MSSSGKYSRPVWMMIREALTEKGIMDTNGVIAYIKERYPQDRVKVGTIRSHMIALAVNHPSTIHYRRKNRFLFHLDSGQYEIYDPLKHGKWIMGTTGPVKMKDDKNIEKDRYYSKISRGFNVRIPEVIVMKMGLTMEDLLVFMVEGDDIKLRKGRISLNLI
jgi:hypothetical protein